MPRNIAPVALTGLTPVAPSTPAPEITWIDPCDLMVDDSYQRNPTERSTRLIRKIIEGWDWARFKAPVCAWTEAGLEVMDGQHTAIAAASHPLIEKIPVLVVEAAEVADRAKAFLGINRDRVNITATQMHVAAVVAGDEDALTIDQVCARAGVRVLKHPPGGGKGFEPGTTMAVAALGALISRNGAKRAREILDILHDARCAPITAEQIRAAELLMTDPEFAPNFEPAELSKTIATQAPKADQEAKVFAATHKVQRWRALASVWYRGVAKRRTPRAAAAPTQADCPTDKLAQVAPVSPARRTIQNAARVNDWRPEPGAPVNFGDPPPGRSALDQRRAEAAEKKAH